MKTLSRAVGRPDIGGEPMPTVFRTFDEAEKIISEDPINSRNNLALASHIYWSFDSAPSLSDIDDEVTAIEELLGEAPALIVIDNLMDISMDGGEEFSNMRSALKELKYLARDTNAAILVLHHTQEGYVGEPCQPRSSLQGKVAQLPALILTVGQSNGLLGVAAVKNRYGKADQSGKSPVWLQFNPEYMFIADMEEAR